MDIKNIDENISIDIKRKFACVYVDGKVKKIEIKNLYKFLERLVNDS